MNMESASSLWHQTAASRLRHTLPLPFAELHRRTASPPSIAFNPAREQGVKVQLRAQARYLSVPRPSTLNLQPCTCVQGANAQLRAQARTLRTDLDAAHAQVAALERAMHAALQVRRAFPIPISCTQQTSGFESEGGSLNRSSATASCRVSRPWSCHVRRLPLSPAAPAPLAPTPCPASLSG